MIALSFTKPKPFTLTTPLNQDNDEIGELIVKSLTGQTTEEEEVKLTEWLSASINNKETYKKVQNEIKQQLKTEINIWNKIEHLKNGKYRLDNLSGRNIIKSIVIATSIVLISTFAFIFLYNHTRNSKAADPITSFTSPNGIFLTLADGQNLNVDSVNSPIRQGNLLLTKSGNEISYIKLPNYTPKEGYNTIKTMFGKQIKIVFLDGSKVWLNAGSTIHYPTSFNSTCRKVNITGEAFFEIAPMIDSSLGAKIPFVVSVNGMEITVKGTKFIVRAYKDDNEIKTSLIEGIIEVQSGDSSLLLQPGQQAILSNKKLKFSSKFDSEEVLSWKNNMFKFKNLEIESLMREISRWYNVTVVYEDFIMDEFTLNVPRNIPLKQLLQILELTSNAHFKLENNTVYCSK